MNFHKADPVPDPLTFILCPLLPTSSSIQIRCRVQWFGPEQLGLHWRIYFLVQSTLDPLISSIKKNSKNVLRKTRAGTSMWLNVLLIIFCVNKINSSDKSDKTVEENKFKFIKWVDYKKGGWANIHLRVLTHERLSLLYNLFLFAVLVCS